MHTNNFVFIATSIDGYIADRDNKIDWLHSIPNPENLDMGYAEFFSTIDAIVMGKNTFQTVCEFEEWPYDKPVFVLSSTLREIPQELSKQAFLINDKLEQVLDEIHNKGFFNLYIDGGKTIQSFLKKDLIDSMIITLIPKLLGGGQPLFGDLPFELDFECTHSIKFSNNIVQNTFQRKRK